MADPAKQKAFGNAGRQRAIETFSWASIAKQTKTLDESLTPRSTASS
jgi:glycosyltransferase involved in cell wall biosynthesis